MVDHWAKDCGQKSVQWSRELFSNIKGFLKICWFGFIETFSFDADVATIAMDARPGELLFYGEGTVKKSRD
ncbi:hypothetical protein U2F10_14970 [Leptothoe sp. EHU-05/26/07-4]